MNLHSVPQVVMIIVAVIAVLVLYMMFGPTSR